MIKFETEWLYSDFKADAIPRSEDYPVHFVFLIRFPDIEPGEDHVAHFCFNVISPEIAVARNVDVASHRGYVIQAAFNYCEIVHAVEQEVANAMAHVFDDPSRKNAIAALNQSYVCTDLNFADDFRADLLEPKMIVDLIQTAFDGVLRGEGTTLHEAMMMDDYGSIEAQRDARKFDLETRWQDVPADDIRDNPSYMVFLDRAGFRYYLPANMVWSITPNNGDKWDVPFFTFLRLFPRIDRRNVGQKLGEDFNLTAFIEHHSFSRKQVQAIYRFLCFMAIEGGCRVDEDKYPAMCQWRGAATA